MPSNGGLAEWSKAIENQFRSRAHVRIMQPSFHLGAKTSSNGGLAEWSKAIEYVSLHQNKSTKTFTNNSNS
ncbi:hypothetical protein N7516_005425 [Penicillium verrucosum]|uniref:uncharacterized protein n=1 Tax=Penicillium verrucosum TaxID=60171 RepID=UPI00254503EA|nr:uncharacterized protein N7516_005425 [Penicillium verrucosum]KAJ5945257.1 hypothetical protein N7516_005425 [Penicillium verrucosum]